MKIARINKRPKKRHIRNFRRLTNLMTEAGDLVVHPDLIVHGIRLIVTGFNETELIEQEITDPDECLFFLEKYRVTWLSVYGLGDPKILQRIAEIFKLHNLAMEDVVNTHQRPKIESYDGVMFATTRMPYIENDELDLEQVSIFWGENFVLSFNERPSDCFEPLRIDIRRDLKHQHYVLAEYTAYAIVDTLVDSFFPVLEMYGLRLDDIEEEAIINPSSKIIINIHDFKRDLSAIRRAMWSQREAIRNLSENANNNIPDIKFFIRDCEDHTIQLIDILESYRERTSGLMDIYLSSVNNKMNEIIKTLTIMSTIFIPIGVVASIYGMNFDRSYPWNMPELSWYYGYGFALGLMLIIGISIIIYFYRKGWLSRRDLG